MLALRFSTRLLDVSRDPSLEATSPGLDLGLEAVDAESRPRSELGAARLVNIRLCPGEAGRLSRFEGP